MANRSRANVLQFISILHADCSANQDALIAKAKQASAFHGVKWDEPIWNVTEVMARRKRGHKSSRQKETLLFTQHRIGKSKVGDPMCEPFSSLLKALVSLRYIHGGQGTVSQMIFVRAARYLYVTLKPHHDITLVNPRNFDEAAAAVNEKEAGTTCYKLIGHLEEIANLIDKNKLSKIRLTWKCKIKIRPSSLSDDRLEDADSIQNRSEKLPSEEAIKAIGQLYQKIPNIIDPCPADDRLRILAISLLSLTGLRIGELLTLKAEPVQVDENGYHYLAYYPQKVSKGNVEIKQRKKYLLTATAGLVREIITEILSRTNYARETALAWYSNRMPLGFEKYGSLIPFEEVAKFGFTNATLKRRLKVDGLVEEAILHRCFQKDALVRSFLKDHIGAPVLRAGMKTIELHEALFVIFHNQMTSQKKTLTHAVRPLNEQHISDFLKGRDTGSGEILSVFEKYDIRDNDGNHFKLKSHGFRHFLNHLLDEGGAPDLIQTEWFGRVNDKDTSVYQHMTPVQRAKKFKEDLQDGLVDGPIVQIMKNIPATYRQAFVEARIQAVHDVGLGFCTHDFSQHPCKKHMQCSANCSDLHWVKTDTKRLEELKRRYAINFVAHETAQKAVNEEYWGASQWLVYNETVLSAQKEQMKSMGLIEFDPITYLKNREINHDQN